MIDFTGALRLAWEQTITILFRPLEPEKWFYIGCSAFLAMMANGGVSLNNPVPLQTQRVNYRQEHFDNLPQFLHVFNQGYSSIVHLQWNLMLQLYLAVGFGLLVLWVIMNWIGSRGEFVFLDNLVRNRAAIAEPWHRYARQGNVWFVFHFIMLVLTYVLLAAAGVGFLITNWSWIAAERQPGSIEISGMILFVLIACGLFVLYSIILFLVQSIVLPLYFKQSMSLGQALRTLGYLCITQPGNIVLYLLASFLLGFVSGLAALVLISIACCVICWLACIPLVGSVLLAFIICQLILPILVYTRCFQLNCLAQMGPEYNVWNVDAPSEFIPPPLHG